MKSMLRTAAATLAALLALALPTPAAEPIPYGEGRELCTLAQRRVSESSGIAASHRTAGVLWTHNDSGDSPSLYAFNTKGEDLGTFTVTGAAAVDWEDIASFEKGGKPWLLIADAGDNDARRKDYALYIVPEPAASQRAAATKQTVRAALAIRFTFEDGPHDCESVAVCTQTSQILLVTKPFQAECGAYSLPLVGQKPDEPLVARKLAVLPVPIPVAMDVSPDGLRAIVLTYGDAFEYARGRDETWAQAFARKPRQLHMPRRGQGEAICYGSDGKTLYLTSEGSPCPLFEVPVADGK